jgi:acylphosphatase
MSNEMNNERQQRLHATLHGHVQGVTFRATARRQASELGLTGWIRNNADGTVETIAEGPHDKLSQFVDFLHDGPPAASVSKVDTNWKKAQGEFDSFSIRR